MQLRTGLIALGIVCSLGAAYAQATTSLSQTVIPALSGATDKGATPSNTKITFTVSLKPANQAAFEAFVDSVSDPTNANYGHWLTPQEVGQRFGASATDQAAVVNFLTSKGFALTLINPNRLAITAQGTASQIQSAFGTTLRQYSAAAPYGGGTWTFRAPKTALKVPTTFASKIVDISGIETYSRPRKAATSTLTPALIRGLYNTLPFYNTLFRGQGRTVAISNFDGFRLSDAGLFVSHFALPTPVGGALSNVSVVTIGGGSGSGTPQGEGDLDIQMALGSAPLATIIIYDGVDLQATMSKESSDNKADVITLSYGFRFGSMSGYTACHNLMLAMSAQGITNMAASGDFGTDSVTTVPYPGIDPECLMVGGTVATVNDTTGVRITEVGWDGSGGGWDTTAAPFNALPSWQHGTGVPTNINRRLSPDVALHADSVGGFTGYAMYLGGSLTAVSGTSASSPTFAACLAVAEQKLISIGKLASIGGKPRFGRIQNLIYSQNGRSDVYTDITTGSNGTLPNGSTSSCTAKWDTVTGWGAVDFNGFVNSLNTASNVLVAANAVNPMQGDYQSGDLTSIATSDNVYYSMQSFLIDVNGNQADGSAPATAQVASITTDFQISTPGNLVDLKLLVEANADQTGVAGQVFGLNWSTGLYELITSFPLTSADKVNTLNIPSTSFGKFIDGSGNIRLLLRGINSVKAGRPGVIPAQFNLNFDQIAVSPSYSS